VYRDLLRVRREHPALSDGSIEQPRVTGGGPGVIAWLRSKGTERVLFVANLHSEPSEAFTIAVRGAPTLVLGRGVSSPRPEGGLLHCAPMEPQSYAYFRVD
jgi:glycosidase